MQENRPKILLVEDDELNLRTITAMLLRRNYDVVVARDGVEALESIQQDWPDAIVLDLMMPRMNGFQFLRALRERDPDHTPVVVISAKGDRIDKHWAFKLGADAFLDKPFAADELAREIERTSAVAG